MQTSGFAMYGTFKAVTPSDSTLVSCRGLWIGNGGIVALSVDSSTAAVQLVGAFAGQIIPVELNQGRVMSTGTTATSIVALV